MHWLEQAKKNNDVKNTKLPEQVEVKKELALTNHKTQSSTDFYSEYLSLLKSSGFEISSIEETGETPKRCDISGCRKNSMPGWYFFRVVNDAAFGTYGDWRDGTHESWTSFSGESEVDQEKLAEIREQMRIQREIAEKEKEKLTKVAERFIRSKFSSFEKIGAHNYINRKKIRDAVNFCDVRAWGKRDHGTMVIPMYDKEGDICNWQLIDENGTKRFKKFANKKGRFHIIGDLHSTDSVAYCEGFATGCTIWMATKMPVIVCFDSGNLLSVMYETRDLVSGKRKFIAADNDKTSRNNHRAGQEAAQKCEEAFPESIIVLPPIVGYDFNDYYLNGGHGEPKKVQIRDNTVERDGLAAVLKLFTDKSYEIPDRQIIKIWDGEEIEDKSVPDELLSFPGEKMNELTRAVESFGIKSSHQISMMGALTLACGISGRNFMEEEKGNFSSIMSCVIAPSGSGKDYPKKFITHCLTKSEKLQDYIGAASYTSEAAIRNQLMQNPVKISILDEFGDKLSRAINGFGRDVESFDAFKEIYSDCRGVWAGRAYAMQDTSGSKKDMRSEPIYNPSLTILGLSTPQQFVDAITDGHIEGGFLNRFVIVDATNDSVKRKRRLQRELPDWLLPHLERIVNRGGKVMSGNLGNLGINDYSKPTQPVHIYISEEVSDLFWDFDCYICDAYSGDSFMENISVRWVENAIRISVGIAVFENPANPVISEDIANWAISFVQFHGKRSAKMMNRYSYVDKYHKMRNKCLEVIRSYKDAGMNKGEMNRIMPFRGMQVKERDKMLKELESMGYIAKNVKDDVNYRNSTVYYAVKM